MQDTVIKGTGNSRTLASVPNFLTLYPTYEAFGQALINRELPIDVGPVNPTGVDVEGTRLNKGTLLSDEVSQKLGDPDTVSEALLRLANLTSDKAVTLIFDKSGTWTAPENIQDNLIFVTLVGGGGGGGSGGVNTTYNRSAGAGGGGGGYVVMSALKITPGSDYSFTVGAGGIGVGGSSSSGPGETGGSTTFPGLPTAKGGGGGGSGSSGNGGTGRTNGGKGGILTARLPSNGESGAYGLGGKGYIVKTTETSNDEGGGGGGGLALIGTLVSAERGTLIGSSGTSYSRAGGGVGFGAGGGGGTGSTTSSTPGKGGNGANGAVIIKFCTV